MGSGFHPIRHNGEYVILPTLTTSPLKDDRLISIDESKHGEELVSTRHVIDGENSIHLHLILFVGSTARWISVHAYIISIWERFTAPLFSRIRRQFRLVSMDTLQIRACVISSCQETLDLLE